MRKKWVSGLRIDCILSRFDTFGLNAESRAALCLSVAEGVGPVEALLAPAHPVVPCRALRLHLLVLGAEDVAIQTSGQVVPQLGEVVVSTRRALGGSRGRAVRNHVRAGRTLGAGEGSPGGWVFALVGGNGVPRRVTPEDGGEQQQRREERLQREEHSG